MSSESSTPDRPAEILFHPCSMSVDSATPLTTGKLVINDQNLSFHHLDRSLYLDYRSIGLHATSLSDESPHIYLQVIGGLPWEAVDPDAAKQETEYHEIRIFPDNAACVEKIFMALNERAALYPDEEDDEDPGWVTAPGFDLGL